MHGIHASTHVGRDVGTRRPGAGGFLSSCDSMYSNPTGLRVCVHIITIQNKLRLKIRFNENNLNITNTNVIHEAETSLSYSLAYL